MFKPVSKDVEEVSGSSPLSYISLPPPPNLTHSNIVHFQPVSIFSAAFFTHCKRTHQLPSALSSFGESF